MNLDFSIDLIIYALEKEQEKIAWDLWITLYPKMLTGKLEFVSFEEFKNKLYKKNYTNKSYQEIEEEMDKVIKAYERQVK